MQTTIKVTEEEHEALLELIRKSRHSYDLKEEPMIFFALLTSVELKLQGKKVDENELQDLCQLWRDRINYS